MPRKAKGSHVYNSPPELLDRIADKVLSYKPKPVSAAQKRLAKKMKKVSNNFSAPFDFC